jgi:hypothetical protein
MLCLFLIGFGLVHGATIVHFYPIQLVVDFTELSLRILTEDLQLLLALHPDFDLLLVFVQDHHVLLHELLIFNKLLLLKLTNGLDLLHVFTFFKIFDVLQLFDFFQQDFLCFDGDLGRRNLWRTFVAHNHDVLLELVPLAGGLQLLLHVVNPIDFSLNVVLKHFDFLVLYVFVGLVAARLVNVFD